MSLMDKVLRNKNKNQNRNDNDINIRFSKEKKNHSRAPLESIMYSERKANSNQLLFHTKMKS